MTSEELRDKIIQFKALGEKLVLDIEVELAEIQQIQSNSSLYSDDALQDLISQKLQSFKDKLLKNYQELHKHHKELATDLDEYEFKKILDDSL